MECPLEWDFWSGWQEPPRQMAHPELGLGVDVVEEWGGGVNVMEGNTAVNCVEQWVNGAWSPWCRPPHEAHRGYFGILSKAILIKGLHYIYVLVMVSIRAKQCLHLTKCFNGMIQGGADWITSLQILTTLPSLSTLWRRHPRYSWCGFYPADCRAHRRECYTRLTRTHTHTQSFFLPVG